MVFAIGLIWAVWVEVLEAENFLLKSFELKLIDERDGTTKFYYRVYRSVELVAV